MKVSDLRQYMILTLNETDPPTHFEDPVILRSIEYAVATVGALTKFGIQKEVVATADGTAKLPLDDEGVLSVLRVNRVGECGVTPLDAKGADNLKSGWRGCEHIEGEETSNVVIEDDEVWLVPAAAPGTTVTLTVNTSTIDPTDDIPVSLLPAIRHFALQYSYERLYGAHHGSAQYHNSMAYKFLYAREINYGQMVN